MRLTASAAGRDSHKAPADLNEMHDRPHFGVDTVRDLNLHGYVFSTAEYASLQSDVQSEAASAARDAESLLLLMNRYRHL